MSSWRAFPRERWKPVGRILSGFGEGEGAYGMAYAIDTGIEPFLNGRISAHVRLAGDRPINGAGIVARANELRSFIAFYAVTDDIAPDLYSIRLAAFKDGKLESLVGLKQSIAIPERNFHIALQFFSGEMVGVVTTEASAYTLKHILPGLAFPGHCGVIRFYGSSAIAQGIHIEEITMRPILAEEDDATLREHPFVVFLSHSSADKATVVDVTIALKSAGISYWVDHEQITFGDGIIAKIEEGLQKSKYVVVCLSEFLASSGWCRAEYGPILYREFSGDTSRRVIPLSLDGSKNNDAVPLLLSDKMRADFTNKASFSSFIQFLRRP